MNKKQKDKIQEEVRKEISSRFITLLIAALMTKTLIPIWKWWWFVTQGEANLLELIGGTIMFLGLFVLTLITIFLWYFPFTKEGMNTK